MIERPTSFGEVPPVHPNPAKKVYIAMTKLEVPCIIRYSIETGCQKQSVHMHLPPGQRSPFANICHFNSFIPSKSPQERLLGVQNFAKMRRVCVSAGEDWGCKCMGLLSPQVAVAGLRFGECRQKCLDNLNGFRTFILHLLVKFESNVFF